MDGGCRKPKVAPVASDTATRRGRTMESRRLHPASPSAVHRLPSLPKSSSLPRGSAL
ncbi:hypothetical protein Dimus_010179, partial [Dionaea muscipula]